MIPDAEHSWLPGHILTRTDKEATVCVDGHQVQKTHYYLKLTIFKETFVVPLALPLEINESSLENSDDMCTLEELHESIILHNLRERYQEDVIYVRLPYFRF